MLRLSREEDWSDWLAQLIEDSKAGLFARRLFGGAPADSFAVKRVHREVSCYEDWRADIIVEWKDSSYTHVEVKVGDPSLDKTLDTAVAIQGRFHGQTLRGDFILLLPDQRDDWDQKCRLTPDLGKRISALTWVDVARANRCRRDLEPSLLNTTVRNTANNKEGLCIVAGRSPHPGRIIVRTNELMARMPIVMFGRTAPC